LQGIRPTGIDRVGLAYVERYADEAQAVISVRGLLIGLSPSVSRAVFRHLLNEQPSRLGWLGLVCGLFLGCGRLRPNTIVLHTAHSGVEYPGYFRAVSRRQSRVVFMVHDLIPLTHPEYARGTASDQHADRIHAALAGAAGIVANSQATLDDVAAFARKHGTRMPPAVVAHLAPGTPVRAAKERALVEPYFVAIGTLEPRKNYSLLLHVWQRMVAQLGPRTPKLLVIGRPGWKCENELDMLHLSPALQGVVRHLADCSDHALVGWLTSARALLFPSFVEGYGMPLVEALAMGVPVLASDLPVFREIAADVPDYLDPLDGPAWLARIQAYSQPYSLDHARQLARIRAFRPPSWGDHFKVVDDFLACLP
jgi:glycosyltransferase involved in cell wall biosynthesis